MRFPGSAPDSATEAEIFNEFFNSTFTRSSFALPNADGLPFPVRHVSKVEICSSHVSTALGELDPSKVFGCINISPVVLKYCITLLEPITHLLRSCLYTCHSQMTAKSTQSSQYTQKEIRPVSLLCVLSKLLEAIVYKNIIEFLSPLIIIQRFGFMNKHSFLSKLLTF